jgi:two-component system response regulator HydG
VAATNADLEKEVAAGRFRADLFHRLNQVQIAVPALRERPADIAPLARFFLGQHAPYKSLADDTLAAMESYSWPGNVRELRNLMARLAVTEDCQEIGPEALPPAFHEQLRHAQSAPSHSLDRLEQDVIIHALEEADGRRNRAAQMLGISQRTLIRRLKLYGVKPSRAVPVNRLAVIDGRSLRDVN